MLMYVINSMYIHFFLLFCSENDVDDVIDSTFEVEYDWFGKVLQHELKPNGKEIPVTNTNKEEYVK